MLSPASDVFADRSKTDARRFLMLAIPLALLLVLFKVYNLEEPAFFLLAFAGIYLLALYLENSQRKFLLASSACLALACLTRWAG